MTTGRPGSSGVCPWLGPACTLQGRARRAARSGFTLLELVMVMLIMCITLAAAAPALRGFFASRRTEDAAAQVLALVQFARSQAASEGRVYRLNLDPREGTYWLTAQRAGLFERLSTEFGRTFALPQGTVAELAADGTAPGRSYVDFYPSGLTEAAVIRLTGAQGRVVEVACHSPTEPFAVSTYGIGDNR